MKFKIVLILMLFTLLQAVGRAVSQTEITKKEIIFYDTVDPKTGHMKGGTVLREDLCNCLGSASENLADADETDTCDTCIPLVYNGDPGGKLDVIFVATHFYPEVGPESKFADDVDLMLIKFQNFQQFASNARKINFYRVDCIDSADECVEISMNPVCYNKDKLRALASRCPGYNPDNNDQIVVLFNGDVAPFSAAIGEPGFAYMPSNKHLFMIHEFGHSFAGLGDEYNKHVSTRIDPKYPNCASSTPGYTCEEKWGDLMGTGGVSCISPCGYINWYRPTSNSCVEWDHSVGHFCPVCARHVDNLLSVYTDVTSVTIRFFSAERVDEVAVIRWQVADVSPDHIGFDLYRSEAGGLREQITKDHLSGRTAYEVIDDMAPPGRVEYWLRERTTIGNSYWYGPAFLAATSTRSVAVTLNQNHPNPFNPSTTISFSLPKREKTNLSVYSIEGKLVTTVLDEILDAGFKQVTWHGKDARGNRVSTGVYFYRLTAGKRTLTKKMVLLK